MNPYQILYSEQARSTIASLPTEVRARVKRQFADLARDPYAEPSQPTAFQWTNERERLRPVGDGLLIRYTLLDWGTDRSVHVDHVYAFGGGWGL